MPTTNTSSNFLHDSSKPSIKELHPNDVIFGRKALAKKQTGNQLLVRLVHQKKHWYKNAFYREEKKLIADDIIKEIKKLNPPGRFLKKDESSGLWIDIGDKKAAEKT